MAVDKYGNPWPGYRVYPPKRLTPMRAVRYKCLDCCCEMTKEVELCPVRDCPLWPYRLGKYPKDRRGPRSVLKPIKEKCKDCAPEPRNAVRDCSKKCCPLWPYRLGTRPKRRARRMADQHASAPAGGASPSRLTKAIVSQGMGSAD